MFPVAVLDSGRREPRSRLAFLWAFGLAAAGVVLVAGILAVTVPVSLRYEVSDILARMDRFTQLSLWSEAVETTEAEQLSGVATIVLGSLGGVDGTLVVTPKGKTLVVTGTLCQHWHVHKILGNLRD